MIFLIEFHVIPHTLAILQNVVTDATIEMKEDVHEDNVGTGVKEGVSEVILVVLHMLNCVDSKIYVVIMNLVCIYTTVSRIRAIF